jgi:drug/metabolite transporter (DMT)-like permease
MTLGIVFALMAALGWGAGDVFARRALDHMPSGLAMTLAMFVIVPTLVGLALLVHGPSAFTGLPLVFYALAALGGALGYVSGQLLHLAAINKAGVTLTAPLIGAAPLLAMLMGVTLGGERPNLPTVVGAFVIVAGVVILLTDRRTLKE